MRDFLLGGLAVVGWFAFGIWRTIRALRRQEFVLTDRLGRVTDHVRRSRQPVFYWGVLTIDVVVLVWFIYLAICLFKGIDPLGR
jgi:hypothetical protein